MNHPQCNGEDAFYSARVVSSSRSEHCRPRVTPSNGPSPMDVLSTEILEILQKNLPLEQVSGYFWDRSVKDWRCKAINRTLHVPAKDLESPKVRRKNEPAQLVASLIADCLVDACTKDDIRDVSDVEWAFWKPIMTYAMTTDRKKMHLIDQLVQVVLQLQPEKSPMLLCSGFYQELRGLDDAFERCKLEASYFSAASQHSHEMYLELLYQDWSWDAVVRPSNTTERRVHSGDLILRNWRNLNEFIARLYAAKVRMAEDEWRSEPFGKTATQQGWWLRKGISCLVESFQSIEEEKNVDARVAAGSVALIWLTYHGKNLRKSDFTEAPLQHPQHHDVSISCRRKLQDPVGTKKTTSQDAWGGQLPCCSCSPGSMSARWALWFEQMEEHTTTLPLEPEKAGEGALEHKLMYALRHQLRIVLVDCAAEERLDGPADEELERNGASDLDWQREKDFTFNKLWARLRRETPRKQQASAADELRSRVESETRRRLYRRDTEQQILYPIYERNAALRSSQHKDDDDG